MSTIIHVATTGSDDAPGTEERPLRTIDRAARLAMPGDTVRVHEGTYRERIDPRRGGLSDRRRITYEAAPGERVVLKGSEAVTDWSDQGGGVWRTDIPDAVFGSFNPFAAPVEGDWVVEPYVFGDEKRHLGDVFIDGVQLYEAPCRDQVFAPVRRTSVRDSWTGTTVPVEDPDVTELVWFAEVGAGTTTIWANFGGRAPASSLVEVSVRPTVFWPSEHHIDWITVRGFEMAHAATQWAPPTAHQQGLVGPNWAKGWIIEDNEIHHSKCVGVCLGKEGSSGDNYATLRRDKPGYQYQLESVFAARHIGWDKERIGSHVVRRNHIHDCGQAGVVGHLGCAFSRIEDNRIHNIALRREFWGHEIAGVKLHAPIDVTIARNVITDCSLGIWLDWETQGTRITRNVLAANCRDLFVEVSHGPYIVDHNVLASRASVEVVSCGGAFVRNLIGGTVRLEPVMDRATPYHVPHSTQVAGFGFIPGGDDRWVGNLFFGGDADEAYAPDGWFGGKAHYGLEGYAPYPGSWEQYMEGVGESADDHQRYFGRKLPVYARSNVYLEGARPFEGETGSAQCPGECALSVSVRAAGEEGLAGKDAALRLVTLRVELPAAFSGFRLPLPQGTDLERAYYADAEFEAPDGSPVDLATDLGGAVAPAGAKVPAGPLDSLAGGTQEVAVVR